MKKVRIGLGIGILVTVSALALFGLIGLIGDNKRKKKI